MSNTTLPEDSSKYTNSIPAPVVRAAVNSPHDNLNRALSAIASNLAYVKNILDAI